VPCGFQPFRRADYEELLRAGKMAELLTPAERDIESGKTRPMREFMEEFKGGKDIQG
jgi:hypothetical protein